MEFHYQELRVEIGPDLQGYRLQFEPDLAIRPVPDDPDLSLMPFSLVLTREGLQALAKQIPEVLETPDE